MLQQELRESSWRVAEVARVVSRRVSSQLLFCAHARLNNLRDDAQPRLDFLNVPEPFVSEFADEGERFALA